MISIFAIILFTVFVIYFYPIKIRSKQPEHSEKYKMQTKKLWDIAQDSMKDSKKALRAEKALLTILKFDEKNAAAYNRLGILYAKEQKYKEAIECFEIAQSLDGNPSSIHNVGLIYFETGEYEKAILAFEQAIAIQGDVPARYIALAKAQDKVGDYHGAISSLENAFELENNVATLRKMLPLYEKLNNPEAIAAITKRIEHELTRAERIKKRKAESILALKKRQTVFAKTAARSHHGFPTKLPPRTTSNRNRIG